MGQLPFHRATWVTNKSWKEITRIYGFFFQGGSEVPLPPGTQHATASSLVHILQGHHVYINVDKGYWRDSIVVDTTLPEDTVRVTIPLVLREKPGAVRP